MDSPRDKYSEINVEEQGCWIYINKTELGMNSNIPKILVPVKDVIAQVPLNCPCTYGALPPYIVQDTALSMTDRQLTSETLCDTNNRCSTMQSVDLGQDFGDSEVNILGCSVERTEKRHLPMASIDIINNSTTIECVPQSNSRRMNLGSETRAPSVIDAKWFKTNINMRRCTRFVSSEEDRSICCCGYKEACHKPIHRNEPDSDRCITSTWDVSANTETETTNAFGEIEFDGHVGDIKRKFVRVDINTEMSLMLEMINGFRLENPNLLISVAGDTKDFKMKTKLENVLMKAANCIGAWIITGGTQASVMKPDVTEPCMTLKQHVVIGIAPWGVIHNRKALESEEGLWPAKYDTTGKWTSNERFLDPNHSHYILVDDGTQHKLDIEIPFRVKLEQEMAKMKTKTGNDVLIVKLVMGGGQGALKTVDEGLKQDIPAVVVKGSGGAADILAYAFQHATTCDEDDNSNYGQDSNRYKKLMTESLELMIKEKMKKSNINCSIEVIKSCLLKSNLIQIFDLDSDDCEIDAVLLKALMKTYGDRVKNQIANNNTNMLFPLDDMMLYALQDDKADFVKLLLEKGVKLETFLTTERLLKLYNNDSLKRIFKDSPWKKKDEKIGLNAVRHKVQDLVGRNYLQHYMDDKNEKEGQKKNEAGKNTQSTYNNGIKHINQDGNAFQRKGQEMQPIQETNQDGNDVQDKKIIGTDWMTMENPCLDLLIWSVLTNEQDKAKLFWRHGKNKMSAALVAHVLLSALSRETDDRDLREVIDNNSSEFMTLAIKVAKACYKADEKKTYDLLTRIVPQWGNTTCIEIAVNANNTGFISLKVCCHLFDKIWMGGLKPQNSLKRLLLCIAFPPLIIWLARFEEEDQKNSNSDTNISDGQLERLQKLTRSRVPSSNVCLGFDMEVSPFSEALCCFSSKRRKVCSELKAEANDKFDKRAKSSRSEPDQNSPEASIFWKLRTFYNAPIIIFIHNMIFFVAFLFLYSYVLVSKLEPQISAAEICLILWVSSFLIEELIQFSRIQAWSAWNKWKLYKADGWNVLDMLTILLFIIGMLVLMINPQPLSIEYARVILGIDLVCFFLRILHVFHAHRQVGPKLVLIMNMVCDLGSMAAILGVFILAYAVASYAILYPNTTLTLDTLMKILKRPYWNIYGELLLEEIEGEANCSDNEVLYGNGAVPRCPTKSGQYVVPVMMGIYMLMTNILLLSLLIASFSYSIAKVQLNTDLYCSLRRYKLICEYCTKPWLAHPFAILINLPLIMLLICNKLQGKVSCGKCPSKCCKCDKKKKSLECCSLSALIRRRNAFNQTFGEHDDKELCEFEELNALKVYQRMEQTREKSIDIKAKKRDTRLETKVKSEINSLTAKVEKIEQQQNDMSKQLQTIIDSLKELKEHKLETKQTYNENTDEK